MTNLVYEPDVDKRPSFHLPDKLTREIEALLEIQRGNADPSWRAWASVSRDLNQELSSRIWIYPGPTEQDDPPEGGTPVAMRVAA